MVSATDLKNGTTFLMGKSPYVVIKYEHQKIGRGGATVKLKVKNLESGKLEEKTLSSNQRVDEIATIKRPLQYLYNDKNSASFMDPKTYVQTEIPKPLIEDQLEYIKEGEVVDVLFWSTKEGDRPLSVEIPPKVTLRVAETVPGVKGNSATNFYKPAKLENGLDLKVPLFIRAGDRVRVDTRTGEYVERVN